MSFYSFLRFDDINDDFITMFLAIKGHNGDKNRHVCGNGRLISRNLANVFMTTGVVVSCTVCGHSKAYFVGHVILRTITVFSKNSQGGDSENDEGVP